MTDWAGIDEFVAVAQTLSFTEAAKRLQCSTSQVSREISRLEDRVGQRLFYRTTRQVSLTQAGERFLLRCRRLQEERDEALASLTEDGRDLQGLLRMTCAVAYGERFVLPLVNRLLIENPRLQIDLLLTDEVLDLIERGVDLAVRFGKLRDSGLVATRIGSRTRLLCASPAYLTRHGRPTALEELVRHRCLRGAADTWTFRTSSGTVAHRPQGPLRCNSGQAVLDATLAGLGLCWLPDFYLRPYLAAGELVELLPEHRSEDEGVWAVYPHRRHLPSKVKATVERLQIELSDSA